MAKKEEKEEEEPQEEVQTIEPTSEEPEPEKKELTLEEEEKIFGEKTAEDQEVEEKLNIYDGKTEFERIVHQDTGMWPEEWVISEVNKLVQAQGKLVSVDDWKQANEWIRGIAQQLDSAKVIADKAQEFCPEKCANPQLIKRNQYYISDDGKTVAFVPTVCLECPLYAYGLVNGIELAPDQSIGDYKVGEAIPKIEDTEESPELSEEEE